MRYLPDATNAEEKYLSKNTASVRSVLAGRFRSVLTQCALPGRNACSYSIHHRSFVSVTSVPFGLSVRLAFSTLAVPRYRPCFSSSYIFFFCFVGLPCFPSASWTLSLLSLFFFFRPCLIHAQMPEWGRAFVHGDTFLHSWRGPMTLVVGLPH